MVRHPPYLISGTLAHDGHTILYSYNGCRPFSDVELMRSVWPRYDALATDGDTGDASSARIFTFLISAFKRLATSRPTPPYLASLRRCTMRVYLRAILNQIFTATTAWTASRRYGGDGCRCDGVERRSLG